VSPSESAAPVDAEPHQGLYLYGLCLGAPTVAPPAGVDGSAAVEALPVGGLVALVSWIDPGPFRCEGNARDPAWVVPRACRHQEVLAAVLDEQPLLPVRFGAVFSSPAVLEDLLAGHQHEVREFLERSAGQEEWDVKLLRERGAAEARAVEMDPVLRERARRMPAAPGARYLLEKQFRADAEKAAWRRALAAAGSLHAALGRQAADSRPGARPAAGRAGPAAPETVMHGVYLVPRERLSDFLAGVEGFTREHEGEGLRAAATGPWPPFHFAPTLGGSGG
jgi:hypothetical protein